MKKLLLALCAAAPLCLQAQVNAQNTYQHSCNNSQQVQKMTQVLNGAPGQNRKISKRSVNMCSIVAARGLNHSYGIPKDTYNYQVDSSCRLITNDINFVKNGTRLADQQSHTYLKNLASALMDSCFYNQRFVVEGHASAEGSESANLTLSQKRANAIFDYLVRQGVSPSRLMAVGHGESQARFPAFSTEYLLAQDRRVMVYKMASN